MAEQKYTPISCDYYDELELFALRQTPCELRIQVGEKEQILYGKIKNLYARKGEEFLVLDDKTEIRLDQIISVNGKIRKAYKC